MGNMRTQKYRSLHKWNMQICNGPDCDSSRTWPVLEPTTTVQEAVRAFSAGLKWEGGTFARVGDKMTAERVWDKPERYDRTAWRQYGMIAPLYEIDRRMPMPMILWNTYRGRAIAFHWQEVGTEVITSVDWLGPDTYNLTMTGLPVGGVLAVDSTNKGAGVLRDGLVEIVRRARPETIMVFGPRRPVSDVGCDLWWERGTEVMDIGDAEASRIFGIGISGLD